MKKKKLNKQQLLENQNLENKKFNRAILVSFSILFISIVSILVFYTYRCETRFVWHKWSWYGKKVPVEWTCINGKYLQIHKSVKMEYNGKSYYFCGQKCYNHFISHIQEKEYKVADSFSGDSIYKETAIIGLKIKGEAELVFFKNTSSFEKYYSKQK